MTADYSAYKPTSGDAQYASKINAFMDAVQTDMNAKQDISAVTFGKVGTVTANYIVQAEDQTMEVNATVAAITITLPAVLANKGRRLTFRRTDATAYTVTIGSVTLDLQNEAVTLQSNGTAWILVD